MAAAMAIVEGVKKAGGTDTEKLIAAMEGMSFDTPKGKMTFRKEDHQAMQSMYHFKIKIDPASGAVSLGSTGNFANYGGTLVAATAVSGYAFACTGLIKVVFTLGPYGNNNLVLLKQ